MDDQTLLRYSRHIMLDGLDIEGQQRLLDSRVLIVGLGGLGSPAALYLAASGVGTLLLADADDVELSNLQRQILHDTDAIGATKVDSAQCRLQRLNPDVRLVPVRQRLTADNLPELVHDVDVVLDGSDNFATRFAVNAACVAARRPLISGAAIRAEGQLAVFRNDRPGEPCYRCVFPEDAVAQEQTCSETGVLAPLTGVIGSLQAVEAVKLLSGLGTPADSRLLALDARSLRWRDIRLRRDPECPVCGRRASAPGAAAGNAG
jgi:adenylyltransferase/sulfurtransferase